MSSASKLHRRLNPGGRFPSLFYLQVGGTVLRDGQLLRVTVTRGDDTPHPGLAPSVIEWQTTKAQWTTALDVNVSFSLESAFAAWAGGSALAPRASGRLGSWTTEDNGLDRQRSTVQAVHWSALIPGTTRTRSTELHAGIMNEVAATLNHPALPYKAYAGGAAASQQDMVWLPQTDAKREDILSSLLDRTGSFAREYRNGNIYATELDQLEVNTTQKAAKFLPLLRGHGIAPATWAQPVGHMQKIYSIDRVNFEGTRIVEFGPTWEAVDTNLADQEKIDWSHIRTRTATWQILLRSLATQSNYPDNRLESVELDMIHLLSSTAPYDRRIAAQVLGMEVGDPVMIGGDWPATVQGIYLANKITEEITPDSWRLTLGLQSARDVLGWNWSEYLDVPSYTWGQMNMRAVTWDKALKTWNDYALPA